MPSGMLLASSHPASSSSNSMCMHAVCPAVPGAGRRRNSCSALGSRFTTASKVACARTRSSMPSGSSGASMVARDMMGRMASNVSTTRRLGYSRWYSASSSSHSAPPPRPAQALRSRAAVRQRRALCLLHVVGARRRQACLLTHRAQVLTLVLYEYLHQFCTARHQPSTAQHRSGPKL